MLLDSVAVSSNAGCNRQCRLHYNYQLPFAHTLVFAMTLLHNIIIYEPTYLSIQNPTDVPYQRIMRAAHVVKGASANLMCAQLRAAAMTLEQSANQCHEQGGAAAPPPMQAAVQTAHADLKQAAQNYVAYLQSIGV
jgi:hypothetical protein